MTLTIVGTVAMIGEPQSMGVMPGMGMPGPGGTAPAIDSTIAVVRLRLDCGGNLDVKVTNKTDLAKFVIGQSITFPATV